MPSELTMQVLMPMGDSQGPVFIHSEQLPGFMVARPRGRNGISTSLTPEVLERPGLGIVFGDEGEEPRIFAAERISDLPVKPDLIVGHPGPFRTDHENVPWPSREETGALGLFVAALLDGRTADWAPALAKSPSDMVRRPPHGVPSHARADAVNKKTVAVMKDEALIVAAMLRTAAPDHLKPSRGPIADEESFSALAPQ